MISIPTPTFSSTITISRRFIYYLLIFAGVLYNKDEIEKMVKEIFFEVFPTLAESNFGWEKEQKDYDNWDSFAQLNLITFAEAKFGIEFSLEESIEIKSASELVERINSHLK